MRPDEKTGHDTTARRARRPDGFALIAALAILVVLGSLGSVMVRLSNVQQSGASAALLGQRAHWAARSGIEWAMHETARLGACPASATTLNLSEGAVSGFTVVVRCSQSLHMEASDTRTRIQIESEASYGTMGSETFVFRELSAAAVL